MSSSTSNANTIGAPAEDVATSSAIKVIFLDCDGVVSPFNTNIMFETAKMELLKKIVDGAYTEKYPVEIVLSSSWRTTEFGRKEVSKNLAKNRMKSFIGCTPVDTSVPRSVEILRWIDENSDKFDVVNFVALDDIPLANLAPNKAFFSKHAVCTSGSTGLTEEDVKTAISLLADDNNIETSN